MVWKISAKFTLVAEGGEYVLSVSALLYSIILNPTSAIKIQKIVIKHLPKIFTAGKVFATSPIEPVLYFRQWSFKLN